MTFGVSDYCSAPGAATVVSVYPPPQLVNLPPSLRFLIDYYDKIVCPTLVVFDGPNNPFRREILPMAFQSPALMEAVFALAQSHIQSRKKLGPDGAGAPTPNSPLTDAFAPSTTASLHGWPPVGAPDSALHHKNNCTMLLQDQLADPTLSEADPVSATLLILLLHRLCDTGAAHFESHLAGVKQLVVMREAGRETAGRWGWMETIFCWMCSSISNREAQLRSRYLDTIYRSSGWPLESLVSCDRGLFVRLAGLGRINMLSQAAARPGSGGDDDLADGEDDGESQPARSEDDGRSDFWLAWNAMKRDLHEWRPSTSHAATSPQPSTTDPECDSASSSPSPPSPSSPAGCVPSPRLARARAQEAVEMNHWAHACSVYRCAAILYLDRLAYPHLPSSHSVFQNTVRDVLDHVACIPSLGLGGRLLWPLFVAGSECVVDGHRALIRERCLDMQKDSGFFNKFSALDVLERIWKRGDDVDGGGRSIGGRGLRWRAVIGDDEMEYLMV